MGKLAADVLGARVAAALRTRWPAARVSSIDELPGGISSLTFAATVATPEPTTVVVKVAPPGRRPVANRDVLRQARLLANLPAGVRAPAVLAMDAGGDGEPPMFVMEHCAGTCFEPAADTTAEPPSPGTVHARALVAAAHLVQLQAVPAGHPGLSDEQIVSLPDEVRRWDQLLATAPDVGAGLLADGAALCRDLATSVPSAGGPPVLVHGDYRLGNLLFVGTDLRAVIDWEIWSFGDRRLDLAWLACQVAGLHRQTLEPLDGAHRAAMDAVPSTAELVEAHVKAGGQDPADLAWFLALADLKVAATLAALIKQNRKRPDPDPVLESRLPALRRSLDRARRHLDGQ